MHALVTPQPTLFACIRDTGTRQARCITLGLACRVCRIGLPAWGATVCERCRADRARIAVDCAEFRRDLRGAMT